MQVVRVQLQGHLRPGFSPGFQRMIHTQTFYFPCGLGKVPGFAATSSQVQILAVSHTGKLCSGKRFNFSGRAFLPLQEENENPNHDLTGHLIRVAGPMSNTY